jgi:hypothetical protein
MSDIEMLLVDAFRKIATGRGHCPHLARAFGRLARCEGADLVRVTAILLSAIDNGCRRTVIIGMPGAEECTLSELQMLAIVAAAQKSDHALLDAHLAWMVHPPHRKPVAVAARLLSGLLLKSGLKVSVPSFGLAQPSAMLSVVA